MWGTGTKCGMKEGEKKTMKLREKDGKGWMEMETCEVTTRGGGCCCWPLAPIGASHWLKTLWLFSTKGVVGNGMKWSSEV